MTEEQKVAVFQPLLDKFETEQMRLYCADMIKQIPDVLEGIIIKHSASLMDRFIISLCSQRS